MKIEKIFSNRLRNGEHFQFHSEFKKLVTKTGIDVLKIDTQFKDYLTLYDALDSGLKKVTKSVLTGKIEEADKARDEIWSGLVEINRGTTKHFVPKIREAAEKLKILFDSYGNLAIKPLNEQTALTYNILQELEGKYAEDTETVGIANWVAELKKRNTELDNLMSERFDESASKSNIVVKEARAEIDKALTTITERLYALAIIEGAANYETFIKTWNAIVEKYATSIKGKKSNDKPEETKQMNEE